MKIKNKGVSFMLPQMIPNEIRPLKDDTDIDIKIYKSRGEKTYNDADSQDNSSNASQRSTMSVKPLKRLNLSNFKLGTEQE